MQENVSVTQATSLQTGGQGGGAPIVQQKPAVGWEGGQLLAATDARLQLSNTTSYSRNLKTQWEGSLVFDNTERERTWEDIQKGDLHLILSHRHGDRFFANFRGTTDIQVVGTGVILKPTSRVGLQGFLEETIQLQSHGRSCTSYMRLQADLQLGRHWKLQPAVYRIAVGSRSLLGWRGVQLFTTYRRTSIRITHEGARSARTEIQHCQPFGRWTLRVGAQRARWMSNPHRQLLQWGVQYGTLGIDVYHGSDQLALLAQWGPIAVGQSWTPYGVQHVLGVHHLSLWATESSQGELVLGVGFAFRGFLRRFSKHEAGWSSFAPVDCSALRTPHIRWPGFGSTL